MPTRPLRREPVLEALGCADADERVARSEAHMAAVTAAMQRAFDLPVLEVRTDGEIDLDAAVAFVVGRVPSAAG